MAYVGFERVSNPDKYMYLAAYSREYVPTGNVSYVEAEFNSRADFLYELRKWNNLQTSPKVWRYVEVKNENA